MVLWKRGPYMFQATPSNVRWFSVVVVVIPYISSCGSLEIMKGTGDAKTVSYARAAVKNPESNEWALEEKLTVENEEQHFNYRKQI